MEMESSPPARNLRDRSSLTKPINPYVESMVEAAEKDYNETETVGVGARDADGNYTRFAKQAKYSLSERHTCIIESRQQLCQALTNIPEQFSLDQFKRAMAVFTNDTKLIWTGSLKEPVEREEFLHSVKMLQVRGKESVFSPSYSKNLRNIASQVFRAVSCSHLLDFIPSMETDDALVMLKDLGDNTIKAAQYLSVKTGKPIAKPFGPLCTHTKHFLAAAAHAAGSIPTHSVNECIKVLEAAAKGLREVKEIKGKQKAARDSLLADVEYAIETRLTYAEEGDSESSDDEEDEEDDEYEHSESEEDSDSDDDASLVDEDEALKEDEGRDFEAELLAEIKESDDPQDRILEERDYESDGEDEDEEEDGAQTPMTDDGD